MAVRTDNWSEILTTNGSIFKSGACLRCVMITPGSTASTVTIYNNDSESGDILFKARLAANGDTKSYPLPGTQGDLGLYLKMTGTGTEVQIYTD